MCKKSFVCALVFSLAAAGSVSAGMILLQCDAGEGALQAGWTRVNAGLNSNVAGSGINVTLATGNPVAIDPRNKGGSGPLADVETDFYFANDENYSPGSDFILTLGNLTPGAAYKLLSYHSRTDEGDTTIPNVTITGATDVTVPASIVQTHAIMETPAECLFTAGTGDVVIRYQGPDGGCPGCQAFFNGFVLELNAPTITFESDASGGLETISPAIVPVSLIIPEPGETYTVQYAATGGSAAPGDDYTLTPDTLIFSPGQSTKNISINIVNDGVPEEDETIILELSNATGPDVVLGIDQHTYTISDSQPKVSFDSASSTGLESATPAMITVKLSHASDETVTVNYARTGGTATGGGVDYTLPADGTLTFEPLDVTEYISIDIIDDSLEEGDETIVLSLSDPCNATLGTTVQHTYSILDNEQGVVWDGLVWYYSHDPDNLFVNTDGDLEWSPEKGGQFITRIPDLPLNEVGNIVQLEYMWMTDGDHDCPPNSCLICEGRCSDDIRCISGTSDMRVGLFEADGEYIESDVFSVHSSIFTGYKGYNFRFGPNMDEDIPTRWVDCWDEVHKTGNICKKPEGEDNLMTYNRGEMAYIPGFNLAPGEYSYFCVKLERTSSSNVELSVTLNGRTYTDTDTSSSEQPGKIDVVAVHMRNGRPYDRMVLGSLCRQPPADLNDSGLVEWDDVRILAESWLERCRVDDWCGGRDINQDTRADLLDFAILGADWLQECSTLGGW